MTLAAIGASGLLALSTQAQPGQPRGPALNWVRLPGAESCIASVELAARVEQRLGQPVFVRMPDAIVMVEGQIGPAPDGGFAAAIRVSDPGGEVYGSRELASADADCRKLDGVLALVIAVTIRNQGSSSAIALPAHVSAELDALFGAEPTELDPATLPPAPATADRASNPGAQQAAAAAPPAPPPEPSQLTFGVGVGLLAATGLQPDGTLGPALHARSQLPHSFGFVLSASLGLSQRIAANDPQGSADAALTLQPLQVAFAACSPELRALSSALALCGHVAVGWLHAEANDFLVENRESRRLWVQVGPEASARTPLLAPLYMRIAVRMPVRLTRPRFQYVRFDGRAVDAFRMAPLGVEGELALGIDLS